ncbi:MAG: hypothetical protein MRZ34_00355 [Bacillales bacterium]|nr:hypothetical protein [Bacillales bacterium]
MIISIVLFILCTLGAILIVLQSMMGAIVQLYLWVPVVIMLLIAFIKSIIDYKKNKKAIKYTSKKEQLYSIINNTQKYHKIITDDKYIDLILISSFGIMTINVLSIDGEIKLLDNNKLYYKEKGGKEGTIVNFLDKINEEVEHIKKVTNTNEIKKYLIVGKGKVSNDNFATGFNVKYISEIYYEIEKIKDNTYSNEDIDRMYELIDSGCNKN